MHENIISSEVLEIISDLADDVEEFYLAGGTGIALQLGHRKSLDLDFFSPVAFNNDILLNRIAPENILLATKGTIHCIKKGVKLSFLFYREALVYPEIIWRKIKVADFRDIAAEKVKTVSQRGAKKDFYDLYAALKLRLSIEELFQIFNFRFESSGINRYHVLKSLFYFNDAETDPEPMLFFIDKDWAWDQVKAFFEQNLTEFEKHLLSGR